MICFNSVEQPASILNVPLPMELDLLSLWRTRVKLQVDRIIFFLLTVTFVSSTTSVIAKYLKKYKLFANTHAHQHALTLPNVIVYRL